MRAISYRTFLPLSAAALLALFTLLFFSSGCGTGDGQSDLIFLITLDTTRADHIQYQPDNNSLTPNIAQLANNGFYFENAYSLIPITLPSHATMFYSMQPHRLKMYNNGQPGKISFPSLAQLLKGKGFQTGAVIALGVLKGEFGLKKGFDSYVENFKPYLWEKTADHVNRDAFKLIKESLGLNSHQNSQENNQGEKQGKNKKHFFWIHYADPHEPYFPPCNDGDFTVSLEYDASQRKPAGKQADKQQGKQKANQKANQKGNQKGNQKIKQIVNQRVFTCRSIEYAVVKGEMQLKPGKNRLLLEAAIPTAFAAFSQCKPSYFKFREFSLTVKDASQASPLQIITPAHWKARKKDGKVDYYSDLSHSQLIVTNKSDQPVTASLRFLYSMHMDPKWRRRFYREEIKFLDAQIGQLVAFLKKNNLYERATFIIVGDHGEGLGEYRSHYGHIHYLNKTYNQVPLIVSGAGISRRGKRTEAVSPLHIAPTILELAGIGKPKYMLGQSLLKPVEPKKILLETYSPEAYFDAFSLIQYPWQVIFYPGRPNEKLEFYHLPSDPQGINNLNHADYVRLNTAPSTNSDIDTKTNRKRDIESGADATTGDKSKNKGNSNRNFNLQKARKIKTELVNSLLRISRIITATKGKIGKSSKRHQEILKSLGYL